MFRVLLLCATVRAIQALLVQTYFNPDEYWQSLEIAHHIAFGYGHKTWEWTAGLRGYTHPAIFATFYKALHLAGLDTAYAVAKGPQLLQAAFAAVTDIFVYKLAALHFSKTAAKWSLLCQLASWFNGYCLVRTYSNSFEALCTVTGVYYWLVSLSSAAQTNAGNTLHAKSQSQHGTQQNKPLQSKMSSQADDNHKFQCPFKATLVAKDKWHTAPSNTQKWLLVAAVGVLFRPSSMLFWVPIGMFEVARHKPRWIFVLEAVGIGGLVLLPGAVVDRIGYGRWVLVSWEFIIFCHHSKPSQHRWVLVPWEFVKFNLLQDGSALYGRHPWHWNFSQGLPTTTFTFLPLALWGMKLSPNRLELAALVLWSLLMYSLPAHKEFRFLLPALCMLMPYCGRALEDLSHRFKAQVLAEEASFLQELFEDVKHYQTQHKAKLKVQSIFSLDRATVAKALEMSRRLEEDQGSEKQFGCPFMATFEPTKLVSAPAVPIGSKQTGRCPFSRALLQPAEGKENALPSASYIQKGSGQEQGTDTASAAAAVCSAAADHVPGTAQEESGAAEQTTVSDSSATDGPRAICPFAARTTEALSASHDATAETTEGEADANEASESVPVTADDLQEYEEAFARDPDEAMLQAYASLLADKVAEADTAPGDKLAEADTAPGDKVAEADSETNDKLTQTDNEAGVIVSDSCHDQVAEASAAAGNRTAEQGRSCQSGFNLGPLNATEHTVTAYKDCPAQAPDSQQAKHDLSRSRHDTPATSASRPAVDTAAPCEDQPAHDSCTTDSGAQQTQGAVNLTAVYRGRHCIAAALSSVWQELVQQPARWHVTMIACFGIQLAMFLYLGLVHQRGQIEVMHYLAAEAKENPNTGIMFLMPCHATPYYSHVHANISMDFLDCSPPGWAEATRCLNDPGCDTPISAVPKAPVQEAENQWMQFKRQPVKFLTAQWKPKDSKALPTHLVMFNELGPALSRYLAAYGFSLHRSFFNCHFQVDAGTRIWVWKRTATSA